MGEEQARGSGIQSQLCNRAADSAKRVFEGSLSLTDELNIKALSEGKRDLDKESVLNVIKNSAGQFNLEAAIKNVDTMSKELKKINVESQLLLCDLILNFSHPEKAKDFREAEEKTWSLTD